MQVTVMGCVVNAYVRDVARLVAHLKGYDHLDIENEGAVTATGPKAELRKFKGLEEFVRHCLGLT